MTQRRLMMIATATLPLVGCTVNLGNDAGSDGTETSSDSEPTTGDGDGDTQTSEPTTGDGDGDTQTSEPTTGDGDGDTQSCPDGTLDCPCYGNDTCNDGLDCNDGICEPAGGDGDGDPTGDGDGDGDGVDLTGWTKKRDIIIQNLLATPLDDYQTLIVIDYDADMQIDFEDLRFTNEADDTLLPYWVEEYSGVVSATVFIRIPHLEGADVTTIHMYYGNPDATSASDGTTTFDFFDGFEGPNLDDSMWTATAGHTLDLGHLRINSGSVYTNDYALHDVGRIEAKMRWLNDQVAQNNSGLYVTRGQGSFGNLGQIWLFLQNNWYARVEEMGNVWLPGAYLSPGSYNQWNHLSITVLDGQLIFFTTRASFGTTFNIDFPGDFFVSMGHMYGADSQQIDTYDVEVDFVLRRGYAEIEPVYVFGGESDL